MLAADTPAASECLGTKRSVWAQPPSRFAEAATAGRLVVRQILPIDHLTPFWQGCLVGKITARIGNRTSHFDPMKT